MPIRLKLPDYLIEVDSEGDLRVVLRVLGERYKQIGLPIGELEERPESPRPIGYGNLVAFVKAVTPPKAIKLLQTLGANPAGLWAEEATRLAGFENKLTISGVVTNIYRIAKKFGYDKEDIISKHEEGSPPNLRHHYKLTTDALEAVMSVYSQNGKEAKTNQ